MAFLKHYTAAVCLGAALALAAAHARAEEAPANLIRNGDLLELDEAGNVKYWPKPNDNISYPVDDDGTRSLRLTSTVPGKMVMAYLEAPVQAGDVLKLTLRMRCDKVVVGEKNWFDARVMLGFKDENRKDVKASIKVPNMKGTVDKWRDVSIDMTVPAGARFLAVMPALFNVQSGTFDVADLKLVKTGVADPAATAAAAPSAEPAPKTAYVPPRAGEGQPLVANGDFSDIDAASNNPRHWPAPGKGVSYPEENGRRFLRLTTEEPGKTVMVYKSVGVGPEDEALRLRFKVRYDGIVRGEKAWFDGRVMMNFKDAEGKNMPGQPGAPNFRGKSGWKDVERFARVPEGARSFEMMFTLFNAQAGTLDFSDVVLDRVAASDVPPPPPSPVSEWVPPPPADKLPSPLRTRGNKLFNDKGEEVWLQGVAIASLEWSATGDYIVKSVGVAIDDWKSNVVRLGVREHFWFGEGEFQKDGGEAYRKVVDSAINAAAGRGAYLVLDLHRFRAVKDSDVAFWKDAAVRYKNHPAVLFELFNEPHDISWEVLRDGGEVTEKKRGDAYAENSAKLEKFHSPGEQKLLEEIRATGANNVVIASGLDWSYDLSGFIKGFALKDTPEGRGIMYSTHVYPWKSGWQKKFLDVAEQYPLFVGECGADEKKMEFLPDNVQEDAATWVPDFLGMIQKNRLHWTAWCFHPHSTPRVLLDWNYTPTPFWGAYVKRALAGEQFEGKKLR